MKSSGAEGRELWVYRYRVGGRGSRCVQRGGFASEVDPGETLERALERLRRANGMVSTLTLVELVDEYPLQHDAEPETIEKLRWLLAKPVRVFGDHRLGQLRRSSWERRARSGEFDRPLSAAELVAAVRDVPRADSR
jgi:hypothetical protein